MTHILRQLGIVSLGQGIGRIAYVASLFLVARFLGVASFGQFMEAFALVALFTNLMDFGLTTLVTREVAQADGCDDVQRNLPPFLALKCLITALVLLPLCVFIILFYNTWEMRSIALLLAAGFAANSVQAFVEGVYFGLSKPEVMVRYAIAQRCLFLVLGVAAAWWWRTAWLVAVCYSLSVLLTMAMALHRLLMEAQVRWAAVGRPIQWPIAHTILRQGAGLALLGVMTSAYGRIDTVMLGRMAGEQATGVYSGAYRCLDALLFLGMVYRMVIYPLASRSGTDQYEKLITIVTETLRGALLLVVPLTIVLMAASATIVELTLGSSYQGANEILLVLMVAWPFGFVNNTMLFVVLALRQDKRALAITIIAVVANVLANLYCIPWFGPLGSAYATVLTEMIMSMLLLLQLGNNRLIAMQRILEPRFILTLVALLLLVSAIAHFNVFVAITFGLLLFVSAIKWFRLLNPLERSLLNHLIGKVVPLENRLSQ